MTANLPLDGVRVLDLTRALSGPFCTALLGDLGADVVKVESLQGEVCRQWGPFDHTESLYFTAVNRNKRSIAMDIWSDSGKELLRSVLGGFDVLVENFRPGVLAALGLDAAWLEENHPDLVVASISGFGHVGPRSGEACFDQIAQGMGGLMSVTGSPESGPMRSGVPLADILTGTFTALGICASLAGERRGRSVHTSLLESVVGVLTFQAQRYLSLGEVPAGAGNDHPVTVPYGVFRTADVPINVAAATQAQWVSLCAVIGTPEFATDERVATPTGRQRHRELIRDAVESRLMLKPAVEWLEALTVAHVPCGPIHDMAGTFSEPQIEALGMVREVEHRILGTMQVARGPLWIGGEATPVRRPAPVLAQHTEEILIECGLSPAAISALVAEGVLATVTGEVPREPVSGG